MAEFDLENFPTSDAARRMMGYVSEEFYEKSYVGKWLFQVMGLEWDEALRIFEEELPKQFFPETATWGLMYHELKWGLPVRQNLSYEERRRLIFQKRDYHFPMTPYRMEKCLENELGIEAFITDVNDPGRFGHKFDHPNIFRVTVIGSSAQEDRIAAVLDRSKQSHTEYRIEFLAGRYDVLHCTYAAVVPQSRKIYEVEVL